MEAANNADRAGRKTLPTQKTVSAFYRLPETSPIFQAGKNSRLGVGRPDSTFGTSKQRGKQCDRPTPVFGTSHPGNRFDKTTEKEAWRAVGEGGTVAGEPRPTAQRVSSSSQIDPSLIATMALEDFNTQPTQSFTDRRRLGCYGSGMSDEDATDVICILHPSGPAAHDAVAATTEHNVDHIIPNADLKTDADESLFDPAKRRPNTSREIALRISSTVKDPSMGFTFGRNPVSCDVLLTKDRNDVTMSNRHFRIYVNPDGVLMFQDTSTNGTLVDEIHLKCHKGKKTDDSSRMLQNGTIITVLGIDSNDIKFLVRIPTRGDHQEAYNTNLSKYLTGRLGTKARVMLSTSENNYGMHWNGGSVYNVVGCLGKGAFATVYKLATKKDGQVYAAKELDKRRFIKNNILDIKFDNEIRIMKDLRHPNIVQYEDYHDHEDWVYMIMENVPFGELSMYLHKRGPIAEPTVQTIARQILHALAYLHGRGITHRDIKPDNILIAGFDPLHVKLSDFGLSKCVTNQETFLKTFCGTLLYCAPEIYPGYPAFGEERSKKRCRPLDAAPKQYSDRVDMWSLGAVLFHVLCNKAPFMVATEEQNKANAMLANIMTRDVEFSPLQALSISEQGIDFVSSLLKRNPSLRPTPKACFEHAWISEVADIADYVDLDDEMPAYRGQGLATVPEAEEELLTGSEEAAFDHLVGPGGLSFGYLNTAGERISKRQRVNVRPRDKATVPLPDEVTYPTLPDMSNSTGSPLAENGGQRLFGEITPSVLQSSGVFGANGTPTMVHHIRGQDIHQESHNDCSTSDSATSALSPPEASEPSNLRPQTLGAPEVQLAPSPSLLEAEVQIGRLNMSSTEATHSDATTPDTANPKMTQTQADPPKPDHLAGPQARENLEGPEVPKSPDTVEACEDPANEPSKEAVFSRYIYPTIPDSLVHNTKFVREYKAREAEAKERRARKAKARAILAEQTQSQGQEEHSKTVPAQASVETDRRGESTKSEPEVVRRIQLPIPEPLNPTTTTTADGFAKPLRRFGKLTTVPGSYADVTFWITSRMTSWGRGIKCNAPYDDKADVRIPHYAIQITYHAPGMESRLGQGWKWENAPGLHTVVSTGTSTGCIWVNGVELRKDSSTERCAYYGKIYTGDIITVYQSPESEGPFLKFRVQIYYGNSARPRPPNEQGFQVLKEIFYHRHELKRRESMKMSASNQTRTTTSSDPVTRESKTKAEDKCSQ